MWSRNVNVCLLQVESLNERATIKHTLPGQIKQERTYSLSSNRTSDFLSESKNSTFLALNGQVMKSLRKLFGPFVYVIPKYSVSLNFQVEFNKAYNVGRIIAKQPSRQAHNNPVEMQCFPLYSILLALNRTTVDFFSLDVEGDELSVLKTIPFYKVNIKMITVEYAHSKGGYRALQKYMALQGYDTLLRMEADNGGVADVIFRKKGLNH